MANYLPYLLMWAGMLSTAVILAVTRRESVGLLTRSFRLFLWVPWKVGTFAVAFLGIVLVAPYTGDPTWDYIDAALMAILTYFTAPWSVGVLYRNLLRRATFLQFYVAVCLWLFSASWFYDAYLLWRDGVYPITWLSNLILSSVLYFAAGLLWNLEWRSKQGVRFAFCYDTWPSMPQEDQVRHIVWAALPFMILAASIVGAFLVYG